MDSHSIKSNPRTNTSSVTTLKEVFNRQPKIDYRRNFLLENKLKLSEVRQKALERQEEEVGRRLKQERALGNRWRGSTSPSVSASIAVSKRSSSIGVPAASKGRLSSRSLKSTATKKCLQERETQTDDILDAEFLYNALRKCRMEKGGEDADAPLTSFGDGDHDDQKDEYAYTGYTGPTDDDDFFTPVDEN